MYFLRLTIRVVEKGNETSNTITFYFNLLAEITYLSFLNITLITHFHVLYKVIYYKAIFLL